METATQPQTEEEPRYDLGPEPQEPEDNQDPDAPQHDGELLVTGHGQLGWDVGGKQPTGSTIRLLGGKIELPTGQFRKGETVELIVAAKVTEVHFVDELDNETKQVVGCERRHRARIVGVELPE